MADVRFYHLEKQSLDQVLPKLVGKALENNHRIVIQVANDTQAEHINTHLWTFDPDSFIPHGTSKDGHEKNQPVWITSNEENPNDADVLILTSASEDRGLEGFALICDIIDGRNDEAVSAARTRWKTYKESGHDVTYWQQSATGGWDKKA